MLLQARDPHEAIGRHGDDVGRWELVAQSVERKPCLRQQRFDGGAIHRLRGPKAPRRLLEPEDTRQVSQSLEAIVSVELEPQEAHLRRARRVAVEPAVPHHHRLGRGDVEL